VRQADHLAATSRELAAIQAVLNAGPLGVAVPTCPTWTLADLAVHVGEFCGFWAHVLCEGTGRPKPFVGDPPRADPGEAEVEGLAVWFEEVADALRTELAATPPETAVWTWYEPDQTAGFVARRVANELAVHRYDAQSARGRCAPIDTALALDGIDEILDRLLIARDRSGKATGETLHLHATDDGVTGEWLVVLEADGIDVQRQHAKGDLALRGSASDLELLLYRRPPLGTVEQFGDPAVLEAWYREFVF
jgi:uncharacterized protein (TIGR03083 family)